MGMLSEEMEPSQLMAIQNQSKKLINILIINQQFIKTYQN